MVGGVGQVDYTAFDGFDYVALGHIHAAYPVGRDTVRYAGSPLCYHFEETKQHVKGPVLVELGAKTCVPAIETRVIAPLHPMREIKGEYSAIQTAELQNPARGEYVRIVLTDRRPEPEIYSFFHGLFEGRDSILMELTSEYDPFQGMPSLSPAGTMEEKTIEDLFIDFYSERFDGDVPDQAARELLRFVGEQVRHAERDDALEPQVKALRKFASEQEDAE